MQVDIASQSSTGPLPFVTVGINTLLFGAEPSGLPNIDDNIWPSGLTGCVCGGGMAKYRVAISCKACKRHISIKTKTHEQNKK
jgi:hypothetical protein